MKALTIGSAMIDTIAIIDSDRIERMSMANAERSFLLLEEGLKTEALEVSRHCGGGGVNAAVAMARLGVDVAALIRLGRDERADTILTRLANEEISARWVIHDEAAPTGASVMVSSHERNAAVFTARGANTHLAIDDIDEEAFDADLVYVSALSDKSADCFPSIIEKAKAHGALVAANPGLRQLSTRGGAFHDSLEYIDILAINRKEADTLVPSLVKQVGEGGRNLPVASGERTPTLAARGLRNGDLEIGLASFLGALHSLGTRYVVLTDGRNGAFLSSDGNIIYCPAIDSEVAGTAGAGDAFVATFAAFIALGRPSDIAIEAAALNAASVVTHVDTQSGLMTLEAIEKRIGGGVDFHLQRWSM
jgi:ribokinase